MRFLLERKGTEISLLPPICRGGEGSIHPIAGEPGVVAKLFTQPSRQRSKKLKAMVKEPPVLSGSPPVLLAWPLDRLLTASGECVGFVMPFVKDKATLSMVYHTSTRPRWADHAFLLRTAKNVAIAVSALHRHGYVVGDLKASNILVGRDASVAVVDMDSVQVRAEGQVFRCEVGTDDFTAPEILQAGRPYRDFDRHQHHDGFGLAVLIFHLLMDGNHPFAARYIGTGTRPPLKERIIQGHWPHSNNGTGDFLPRRQAPPFESLSPTIQRLMRNCFEAGHINPTNRPTADEWVHALEQAEDEWKQFRTRLRFAYYRKLNFRAWGHCLLVAPECLRSIAVHVPRKARFAVLCAVGIALLWFALFSWPNRTQPPHSSDAKENPAQLRGRQGELMGEETPWLWKEAQRQNRMKK